MDLGVRNNHFAVIGGSRGMGWAAVETLANEGANVFLMCRDPDLCGDNIQEIAERNGVQITGVECDVSVEGSVEEAMTKVFSACDRLNGLAVTNYSSAHSPPFTEMSNADWDTHYQNVFMGSIRPCQVAIPHMIERGGGAIVLTASYSALVPKSSLFAYASLKAGIIHVTKNIAQTYGEQGVRANCVCPGYIRTARAEARIKNLVEQSGIDEREAERQLVDAVDFNIGLNRLGAPAEVGDMIAFLLSERASYVSGATITIDGASQG